jgi:hypothetical protein
VPPYRFSHPSDRYIIIESFILQGTRQDKRVNEGLKIGTGSLPLNQLKLQEQPEKPLFHPISISNGKLSFLVGIFRA